MRYDMIVGVKPNELPLDRSLVFLVNEALKKGAVLQGGPVIVGSKLVQAVLYPDKK